MSDILVLTAPYLLSKEAMKRCRENFLKQKEEGVVVLPSGWTAELVPDDVQIRICDQDTSILIRDCSTCSLRLVSALNEPCISCFGAKDENGKKTLPSWKEDLKAIRNSLKEKGEE